MHDLNYRISLNMHNVNSQVSLLFKQNDTGVTLYITLHECGTPYILTEDCSAVFVAKVEGTVLVVDNCVIDLDNNRIIYEISPKLTSEIGVAECEVRLYGNENLITSPCFEAVIAPRVVSEEDDIVNADPRMDAIDTILASEAERILNENKRIDNENERIRKSESGEYNGATFFPVVSHNGLLSWKNDKGLDNPDPTDISGVKLVYTLPENAQNGDICLWSEVNNLIPSDGGGMLYLPWKEILKEFSDKSINTYHSCTLGDIYIFNIFFEYYVDGLDQKLTVSLDEYDMNDTLTKAILIVFLNGEFNATESHVEELVDDKMVLSPLTEAPLYCKLPFFEKFKTEYSDIDATLFYSPPRTMYYRDGWHQVADYNEFIKANTVARHTHKYSKTLDALRCTALEDPLAQNIDDHYLKFNGSALRFVSDGAVVKRVSEVEKDGQAYLRLWLHDGRSVIVGSEIPDYIDIPVSAVISTESKDDNGLILNGSELELPSGGANEFVPMQKINATAEEINILLPNKEYAFGECSALTINFAEGDLNSRNEYLFSFISGETATVLTLPSSVKWVNELTVEANKRYEISVVDNVALWCAVDYGVSE